MSRNSDRVGGPQGGPPTPVIPAQPSSGNDWLSFVTATEHVELPSKGRLYPDGHPLKGVESIEIKYMTAKEEDILTSQNLIKKGIAIERLLKSVVLDKSIDLTQMLVGDKNAILLAARETGYGSRYDTKVTCSVCGNISETSFDMNQLHIHEGGLESADYLEGVTEGKDKMHYLVKLPKMGLTVEIRLLIGLDEKMLAKANQGKRKSEEGVLLGLLERIIVSISNGEGQREDTPFILNNFIRNALVAQDAQFIRAAYKALMPNAEMKQLFDCESCNYVQEIEMPVTSDFFWPGSK